MTCNAVPYKKNKLFLDIPCVSELQQEEFESNVTTETREKKNGQIKVND